MRRACSPHQPFLVSTHQPLFWRNFTGHAPDATHNLKRALSRSQCHFQLAMCKYVFAKNNNPPKPWKKSSSKALKMSHKLQRQNLCVSLLFQKSAYEWATTKMDGQSAAMQHTRVGYLPPETVGNHNKHSILYTVRVIFLCTSWVWDFVPSVWSMHRML